MVKNIPSQSNITKGVLHLNFTSQAEVEIFKQILNGNPRMWENMSINMRDRIVPDSP